MFRQARWANVAKSWKHRVVDGSKPRLAVEEASLLAPESWTRTVLWVLDHQPSYVGYTKRCCNEDASEDDLESGELRRYHETLCVLGQARGRSSFDSDSGGSGITREPNRVVIQLTPSLVATGPVFHGSIPRLRKSGQVG